MSFHKILIIAAIVGGFATMDVSAHEDEAEDLPKESKEVLNCRSGGSAFLPDTQHGEGNVMLIIENQSRYQLRLQSSGVFKDGVVIDPHHCIKRFAKSGEQHFSLTAYLDKRFQWLVPIHESVKIGEAEFFVTIPRESGSLHLVEISTDDIPLYSPARYRRENRALFIHLTMLWLFLVLCAIVLFLSIYFFLKPFSWRRRTLLLLVSSGVVSGTYLLIRTHEILKTFADTARHNPLQFLIWCAVGFILLVGFVLILDALIHARKTRRTGS